MKHKHIRPDPDTTSATPQPDQLPGGLGGPRSWNIPWHLVTLSLLLIAPFAGILVHPDGRVLGYPKADNPSAYYFLADFAGHQLRSGSIPLWNPFVMLGIPFLGDGEAAVFHPLSLLFVFLETSVAINWLVAISFTLTGLFFYGYLRALCLSRTAAWCGTVVWSFSNAMISRVYAGHLNVLLTMISIPWVMMLWERYRTRGGVRHLLGISLGYGLMVLAYYPQLMYIFSLFLLLTVLIECGFEVRDRASARRAGRTILLLGAFILLGIGLGSIQLLPSFDFISQSFRKEATIRFSGSYSFPPENLLTLIAPDFFGSSANTPLRGYWGRWQDFWEMWIYIGAFPLLMAAVGAWAAPRRRRATLLICGLVFLLLGFGENTPLFPLIYHYIPLFDIFRGTSKNTLVTLFCLVTLSAYGLETLLTETDPARQRRLRWIATTVGAALLLFAVGVMAILLRDAEAAGSNWQAFLGWIADHGNSVLSMVPKNTPWITQATVNEASAALLRGMIFLALSVGVILLLRLLPWRRYLLPVAALLTVVDLLTVFLPLCVTFDKSITQLPEEFKEVVAGYPYPPRILIPGEELTNLAMHYRYSSPFGYMGNTLKRYNDFISLVQDNDPLESRAAAFFVEHTPHFRILALDAMVMNQEQMPAGITPIGRLNDKLVVPYEAPETRLPRAFLAETPRYFSRPEEALAYVFAPDADPLLQPAIERADGEIGPFPLSGEEGVGFLSYTPQRVELTVRADRPRELVLCEMFEKNWRAWVNGALSPVAPANYAFRAVRVPAGESRVVFEYQLPAFSWGVAGSAVSFALLLLVAAMAAIRRRSPLTQSLTTPPPGIRDE